jgi:hypothetical protein
VDNRFLAERENMATISTPSQMSPNARGLFEILKEANIKQMQYCLQLHHELAVTEGEFAARDYEEQFPALPDGIEASAPKRKPPAREKAPDDPLRDACTSAKFAAEVGMGDDYVRDWFTAHPDGAYVDGRLDADFGDAAAVHFDDGEAAAFVDDAFAGLGMWPRRMRRKPARVSTPPSRGRPIASGFPGRAG